MIELRASLTCPKCGSEDIHQIAPGAPSTTHATTVIGCGGCGREFLASLTLRLVKGSTARDTSKARAASAANRAATVNPDG